MWLKQLQIFNIDRTVAYDADAFAEKLAVRDYEPCLPSIPSSAGWISPFLIEDGVLVHAANGFMMFCLQVEEKVLPATIVRQTLDERVKSLESDRGYRVRHKEKLSLKDDVIATLLPRAFSKLVRVYAIIDTNKQQLWLSTTNKKHTDTFFDVLKVCMPDFKTQLLDLKRVPLVLTNWVGHQSQPSEFIIEESCVLQDARQQGRVIRCSQQDLTADQIQEFLKEGCEVKQLALTWQERITFNLAEDFTLRGLKYADDLLESHKDNYSETPEQQFDADFVLQTENLTQLIENLITAFSLDNEEQLAA